MVDGLSNLCVLVPEINVLSGEDGKEPTISDKHKHEHFDQQTLDKADLIVVGSSNSKEFIEFERKRIKRIKTWNPDFKPSGEVFEYPAWAIYGNVMVETSVHKGNIKQLRENTKVVWAYHRPYILNGDSSIVLKMEIKMKCKYLDKYCGDRYVSHSNGKETAKCRLSEWKKKIGICPYDKTITAPMPHTKRLPKTQSKLKT